MILDSYIAMAQEPWCFDPDKIARLTDWQILNLYLKPAQERAEKLRSEMPSASPADGEPPLTGIGYGPKKKPPEPGEPGYRGPDGEPGSDIHRNQCIGAYQTIQGLSLAQATAQYERQLAEWHAEQGGK